MPSDLARGMNNAVTARAVDMEVLARADDALLRARGAEWDERFASDPARLIPLIAALDLLPRPPARVLDVGTGTGAAALVAAERWPDAQVTGIDMSPGDDRRSPPRRRSGPESASWSPTSRRSIPVRAMTS